MKVKWILNDMDTIKNKHLEANAAYWKFDMLLNAQKALQRIKGSTTLKVLGKGSQQLENMIFLVENKANIAKNDIDNLVDFEVVQKDDGSTEFVLFVNETYFSEHDMLKNIAGRRMKRYLLRTKIGRQQLIDNFEKEIRNLYTNNFTGIILESDGHNLSILQ